MARKPEPVHPEQMLDLLSYGSPAPLAFDPRPPGPPLEYSIGRRPGFLDGLPGLYWTINGQLYPDVSMYIVA